ncbi:hypothetical protein [Pseudomonas viridiflava]|uniref:CD-NTase-associated protein 12/Pycsar effector protein TIR domain-containing protein n=1 Tax=Pseudomonas viridiflava TaxID=33069 RepID=A0AA46ZRM7_PSEVI|nr:hypothetical protein [Pseudomonas viridiflava]UZA66851.1 hypothetical protein EZZ81_00815 [Pseudomonas viridiflava]
MKRKKGVFRVFFSWQSDSPRKSNSEAIRAALEAAQKSLKETFPTLEILIDEATRDTSGSPNIAKTILNKIRIADMVVSDITTINPGEKRPCPNPNVTYELGFAMALLGEERIVMLFNKSLGNFPADLPFDFIQNRISQYTSEPDKSPAVKLAKLLKIAIKAVIDKSPKTPAQLSGVSREEREHSHDIENLKWLFSKVHIPTLSAHIHELPKMLTTKALWFWEGFNGVVDNNRFSLYDECLYSNIRELHRAWLKSLSHADCYHDAPGGDLLIFTNPLDGLLGSRKQNAWDEIDEARGEMKASLEAILSHVRARYIEVKIDKRSDHAWRDYVKEAKEQR